jgi:hypothetical protein
MKRLIIAASLALASCGPTNVQSVNTVATKSVIAANDLYAAASRAGEDLVKLGLMDKATFKAADARAYAVLIQVRAGHATLSQLSAATAILSGAK